MFNNVENKSDYMTYFIKKVIDIIMDNYFYDVTYDELYHAAIKGMTNILDEYSTYIESNGKRDAQDTYSDNSIYLSKSIDDYYLDEIISVNNKNINKSTKVVRITEINNSVVNDLKKILDRLKRENIRKLIIDLRDNMGGPIDCAIDICNLLVEKSILFKSYDKSKLCDIYRSELVKKSFEDIIVLTNNRTMSAAEAIAAALQDNGNIVIGQKTFGKGVSQKIINIYGGGILKISSHEYVRYNDISINNIGVIPDILINDSNNEVLKAAYDYITQKPLTKSINPLDKS